MKTKNHNTTDNQTNQTTTTTSPLRASLQRHDEFLRNFATLFTEDAEYMMCVDELRDDWERLESEGVSAFTDKELEELAERIRDFQQYSAYWGKAIKPLLTAFPPNLTISASVEEGLINNWKSVRLPNGITTYKPRKTSTRRIRF